MYCLVIVGRPNVGKSTLFNRIAGRRKALVHNLPGVTRDRIVETVTHEGRQFQLVDTGGILGASQDPIHALVEEQVNIAITEGDHILLVVDGDEGLLPVEREIAKKLRQAGKRITLVVNKVDDPKHSMRASDFYGLGIDDVFSVSAEHGPGVEALLDHVLKDVAPEPDDEAQPETVADGRIRVAIVGRPNVGKSSLLNCIIGQQRALVSSVAGTTRDPVDAPFSFHGQDFVLVDTAGIRRKSKTDKGAELLSVLLAKRALGDCHVALLVVDASQPPSHQDAHIAGLAEEAKRAIVVVLNKWDLVAGEKAAKEAEEAVREKFAFCEWAPMVRVSAKSGRGVEKLFPQVVQTYENYTSALPTAVLNKALQDIVRRVSPPAVQGKLFKVMYATQTGTAPPTLTVFTNSMAPPPLAYSRYLKNQLRAAFPLEGSPLIVKYRKD